MVETFYSVCVWWDVDAAEMCAYRGMTGCVVTVYERVVRIQVGPHHGRDHCGDNTPLSDCLIRQI